MAGHIVAMGGWNADVIAWAVSLSRARRPRLVYVPTAVGDADWAIEKTAADVEPLGVDLDVLRLFGVPDAPLQRVERADVVLVNGGNTANMLAVWRVHAVDVALRRAWERGAVLAGWSAGANCWFEASVTDSFRPDLQPLHDGLGLLGGSFCPHFDGEPARRPTFTRLVADGVLPSGLACDDAAAAWFEGTVLREIVTGDMAGTGWEVGVAGERRLEARPLP